MVLMTLNCWGGKMHEPLLTFLEKYKKEVDVFCLQEVFSTETDLEFSNGAKMNLYQDISKVLSGYQGFYAMKSKGYDYTGWIGKDISFGNAVYVKNNLKVTGHEELFKVVTHDQHDWRDNAIAKAQIVTINFNDKPLYVCNFHGIWINGTEKKDTPERLDQSRYLKQMVNAHIGSKVLAGDFNLIPDGESIKILEQGMRNLIKDYGITSTRSSLYTKEMKYADYILTSSDINVKNCKVLPEEVSDHLALVVEF